MYVELMKNFLLADSSELMLLDSFWSWAHDSYFVDIRSWKIFFSPIPASWWLLDSFWNPEPKNKWFLLCRHDVRRVEFMKNFLLADSSETLMAVRLIFLSPKTSDSYFVDMMYILSPKTTDSYFVDMMYVEFMKIFFSPIRAIRWLLDSFWHTEPKNKWFLLCRHDVRRVHEKFSSRRFERGIGC